MKFQENKHHYLINESFETLRRFTIIAILIFSLFSQCLGQREYLEPEPGYEALAEWRKNYYDTLFPLLFSDFAHLPYARYWVSVSFGKEYSFSVEERDQKFYIISNKLSSSVWYYRTIKKIKVRTSKTEIEESLYKSIGELFKVLNDSSRTPSERNWGSDGNIYSFQTVSPSGQLKTGRTWSPRKGTLFAQLVIICDHLYRIGIGESYDEEELDSAIKNILKKLL